MTFWVVFAILCVISLKFETITLRRRIKAAEERIEVLGKLAKARLGL